MGSVSNPLAGGIFRRCILFSQIQFVQQVVVLAVATKQLL